MTTITGKFIQSILKNKGETMLDDEIFLEAKKMIHEELSANRQELESNIKGSLQTNLIGKTTVISNLMDEVLLEALKKLGKSEIDKEVLAEVDKMLEAERAFKRQVLKDVIKDSLS